MKPVKKRKPNSRQERSRRTSLKSRILAALHCRKALVVVCTLVVLECLCVMAELMVDLQGIRVRFENEEKEVSDFVDFMKTEDPAAFESFNGRTLEEVLYVLHRSTQILRFDNTSTCPLVFDVDRNNMKTNVSSERKRKRRSSRDIHNIVMDFLRKKSHGQSLIDKMLERSVEMGNENPYQNHSNVDKDVTQSRLKSDVNRDSNIDKHVRNMIKKIKSANDKTIRVDKENVRVKRHTYDSRDANDVTRKLFVFTVNTADENFYMVSRFKEIDPASRDGQDVIEDIKKYNAYSQQYEDVNKVSHIIKYIGFGILTAMLCETLLKFACLGLDFFRKKIEVFDAFIVIISFTLDVIFIDSRWYDTGKDATTILVLLLPWRVVRIVNSFIMTINHKHHLEMMWVRKAKKKTEHRLKKLQNLTIEIRRDIDLLISLAKSKGATKAEINSCIYGQGRGRTTLAAITSFAQLMLISTLGKDPRVSENFRDDLYGDMIEEIIQEETEEDEADMEGLGDEGVEEDADSSQTNIEIETQTKSDDDDEEDGTEAVERLSPDLLYSVPRRSRRLSRHQGRYSGSLRHDNVTRRSVIPRRTRSEDTDVYYINNAFVSPDEAGQASFNNRTVSSLPVITSGGNYVTFEVTTQVTYL